MGAGAGSHICCLQKFREGTATPLCRSPLPTYPALYPIAHYVHPLSLHTGLAQVLTLYWAPKEEPAVPSGMAVPSVSICGYTAGNPGIMVAVVAHG